MTMTQAMVNHTFGRAGLCGGGALRELPEAAAGPTGRRARRERRVAAPYRRRVRRTGAPGNTTQFLMGDQAEAVGRRSFSDSDLEVSSESEENFGRKEFAKDYDSQKPIGQKISKSKLIDEFLSVEKEVKLLEKKCAELSTEDRLERRLGSDYDWRKGEVAMEPELAEKIRIFQEEIVKMATENRGLRLENNQFISEKRAANILSSSSDESSGSSDSSDSDSSSDSTESEEEEEAAPPGPASSKEVAEWQLWDDTGYESDRSSAVGELVSSSGGQGDK